MSVAQIVAQPRGAQVTSTTLKTSPGRRVWAGVDTHQLTHHAAVIDAAQNRLGDAQFPASQAGYRDLSAYLAGFGQVVAVGVESTGSYGAGLTRHLSASQPGTEVFEVSRPEKSTRVKAGKSDPIDAYSAAVQVRTGRATGRPKLSTGIVESLRALKVPRDSAVKDRTRAYSQLRDLITTAPGTLKDDLITLTGKQRVTRVLAMRPDPTRLSDPVQATKRALQALARRITYLDAEIKAADQQLAALTAQACPTLLGMRQVGPQTAAQLVITAGQNIDRMRTEATFAKLVGVAPLPASSGKSNTRHRLNRGGDRQANSALYMIIVGRMKDHPETLAYIQRRTAEGMSTPEIIRCLKRHLARSVYRALKHDLMTP
jgi:transposase